MRARAKLRPGQPGTKKLLARYGDRLFCVRYRYDEATRKRIKTVELIVDEGDWLPPPPRVDDHRWVYLRIEPSERNLQRRANAAGGVEDVDRNLWKLRLREVRRLGLGRRVVGRKPV